MAATDHLSSVFVSNVKILFDILDEYKSGSVRLSDIEAHWVGSDCVVPSNIVIQSLRKVASPTGRLTFDDLIVGLKNALTVWKSNGNTPVSLISTVKDGSLLSNSKVDSSLSSKTNSLDSAGRRRRLNKPSGGWNDPSSHNEISKGHPNQQVYETTTAGRNGESRFSSEKQKGALTNGKNPRELLDRGISGSATGPSGSSRRRHTVSTEVNALAMRHLKLMETERSVLTSGLEMVEMTRSGYIRRLAELDVQRRQLSDADMSQGSSLELSRERLDFESSLIAEVNQRLKTLAECFNKGFPTHMNLASSGDQRDGSAKAQMLQIERQNKKLKQELNDLQGKVKKLESEKAQLIREVFQANSRLYVRTASPNDTLDTTLI